MASDLHKKLEQEYWEYFERHRLEIFATDGIDGKVWHQGARAALEILIEESKRWADHDFVISLDRIEQIAGEILGESK